MPVSNLLRRPLLSGLPKRKRRQRVHLRTTSDLEEVVRAAKNAWKEVAILQQLCRGWAKIASHPSVTVNTPSYEDVRDHIQKLQLQIRAAKFSEAHRAEKLRQQIQQREWQKLFTTTPYGASDFFLLWLVFGVLYVIAVSSGACGWCGSLCMCLLSTLGAIYWMAFRDYDCCGDSGGLWQFVALRSTAAAGFFLSVLLSLTFHRYSCIGIVMQHFWATACAGCIMEGGWPIFVQAFICAFALHFEFEALAPELSFHFHGGEL